MAVVFDHRRRVQKGIAFPVRLRKMENIGICYHGFPGADRMNEEVLTIQEVAKLLKVADKTVYTMALKVGGLWRLRRQDLDAWISERVGRADQTSPSDRAKTRSTKRRKAGA